MNINDFKPGDVVKKNYLGFTIAAVEAVDGPVGLLFFDDKIANIVPLPTLKGHLKSLDAVITPCELKEEQRAELDETMFRYNMRRILAFDYWYLEPGMATYVPYRDGSWGIDGPRTVSADFVYIIGRTEIPGEYWVANSRGFKKREVNVKAWRENNYEKFGSEYNYIYDLELVKFKPERGASFVWSGHLWEPWQKLKDLPQAVQDKTVNLPKIISTYNMQQILGK